MCVSLALFVPLLTNEGSSLGQARVHSFTPETSLLVSSSDFQKPFPMPALKMISNQTPYLFQSPAADSLTIGFSPARNILLYKTAEVSHSSSLLVPATE